MKPQDCPWCFRKADVVTKELAVRVECRGHECARGPWRDSVEDAIQQWNRIKLESYTPFARGEA